MTTRVSKEPERPRRFHRSFQMGRPEPTTPPGARQLVRKDGWQAAIFGGRNRPSLLMVAHQLASASIFSELGMVSPELAELVRNSRYGVPGTRCPRRSRRRGKPVADRAAIPELGQRTGGPRKKAAPFG